MGVANLPDHLPTEVEHIRLRECEALFAARERLEKLASEHATVVAVLLLRSVLERPVNPAIEVERLLLFVAVLGIEVCAELLRAQ